MFIGEFTDAQTAVRVVDNRAPLEGILNLGFGILPYSQSALEHPSTDLDKSGKFVCWQKGSLLSYASITHRSDFVNHKRIWTKQFKHFSTFIPSTLRVKTVILPRLRCVSRLPLFCWVHRWPCNPSLEKQAHRSKRLNRRPTGAETSWDQRMRYIHTYCNCSRASSLCRYSPQMPSVTSFGIDGRVWAVTRRT